MVRTRTFATSAREIGSFGRKIRTSSTICPSKIPFSLAASTYENRVWVLLTSTKLEKFVSDGRFQSTPMRIFATSARVTVSFGRKLSAFEMMPFESA